LIIDATARARLRAWIRLKGVAVKRESVELTDVQVGMLLFFAGKRDLPCGHTRTTDALIARHLVAWDADSRRLKITNLGRRIAAQQSTTSTTERVKGPERSVQLHRTVHR
jgi:hypothetical protein